ncbi:probable chitinase 10 [Episyrphus balteatus]|uniref:probable chitinase 10 n=1 Tax=Episyrphus balteatus TaxID=286459 RepID=UPI0024859AB4|nr:probable chitinase 10 [Episyrphus balteatus]
MKNFIWTVLAVVVITTSSTFAEINVCEGVKDGIFLADMEDCGKYITCMGGKAYPGSCSDGFQFSARTQRCDEPEKTECLPKCNNTLQFMPYPKTCNKYILCFAGASVLQQCSRNLQYNPETNRCDFPKYVDCVENMCNNNNDPYNIDFVESKADCGRFYICYNSVPMLETCASGLYFNPKLNSCDYKENVNCTISAKSRNVLPYAKMPPTKANIPCPKQGVHFYPNPSDPAAYFFCSNGKGLVLTCSPGLVYNKKLQTCTESKNVK